jgi:glycerol-3-phosphate O-acyltransferase
LIQEIFIGINGRNNLRQYILNNKTMHIEINDNTTIRSIQETFSDFYPYLQLEFYNRPHDKYEASSEDNLIFPGKTIGEIKQTHVSAILEIQPLSKVADIEGEFMKRFGLTIQILRKEKSHWEQTTGMDDFTIKELNEFGRSSSDEFIMEEPDSEYNDDQV